MPDTLLLAIILVLTSVGIVMVYSASAVVAADRFGDPYFFLKRQFFWATLGLGALWLTLRVDYRRWQPVATPLLIVAGVLLVLVLLPPLGQSINGTRRWLRLGGVSFQPVELAKVVTVLFLAAYLTRVGDGIRRFWRGLLPAMVIVTVFGALILRQPDLGNSLALIGLGFTLVFLAGARPAHLAVLAAPAALALAVAVYVAPYRWRRIMVFMNPEADPLGGGFQIIQSYLAIGAGGVLGRGLGESRQKLFYLPESHTDFIFSVAAEEFGLLGGIAIIGLFAALVWRGLRIAMRAPDAFGAYLALGITVMLATQAIVNVGVVTGSLPTKGLPLPFISFGGSALLMTMVACGILLNVSQHAGVTGWMDAAPARPLLPAARPRRALVPSEPKRRVNYGSREGARTSLRAD